jgi:hypothetical protein
MTARLVQWARSESEAAELQRQGWLVDLHQPMTRHSHWALLHYWPHMDRDPPPRPVDQSQFHGATP